MLNKITNSALILAFYVLDGLSEIFYAPGNFFADCADNIYNLIALTKE